MASIRKRTSAPSNGKLVVKYDATVTRVGARRLTKTFTTKAAAESWARKVECDIQAGTFTNTAAAQHMLVEDALDIYLREVVPYLKSAACEPPKARNLKHRLGKLPLSALSTIELAAYRDARLNDQARRAVGTKNAGTVKLDRKVSPQTVKLELGLLNRALVHVEHEHGIVFPRGRPKLDHRRSNALALPPGRDRILNADELARLRKACTVGEANGPNRYAALRTSRSVWLWPVVEFAMETAARRNEIMALRWGDVDNEEGTVTLKNKKTHRSKAPETRTIPMSPRVIEILRTIPGERRSERRVFSGVTTNALAMQFKRAVRRAEIINFRFHDLRHMGATRLADILNGDLLMIADMTGHQDIRMLRRYVAPRRAEIAKLLKAASAKNEPIQEC